LKVLTSKVPRRVQWIAPHVELDAEGQVVADTSRLYKWPKGDRNEFSDAGAYILL
jgi:hypothetical protein